MDIPATLKDLIGNWVNPLFIILPKEPGIVILLIRIDINSLEVSINFQLLHNRNSLYVYTLAPQEPLPSLLVKKESYMTKIIKTTFRTLFACLAIYAVSGYPVQAQQPLKVGGKNLRLFVYPVTDHTIRVTLLPADSMKDGMLKKDLVLEEKWQTSPVKGIILKNGARTVLKNMSIQLDAATATLTFYTKEGKQFQKISLGDANGKVSFYTGTQPLLGLGGGGQNFDRRGTYDEMQAGVPTNEMQMYGSRLPVPLLIGTEGWSLFFHLPYRAAFDLRSGTTGFFIPRANAIAPEDKALPLDFFVTYNEAPARALTEYAALVGQVPLAPKWTFGYMQSHRTLGNPASLVEEAETFRKKKMPLDAMIYLGTGYAPNGWNMGHANMDFNPGSFDRPDEIIKKLHDNNLKVILHVNNTPRSLHGEMVPSATDTGRDYAYNYWQWHLPVYNRNIDGWWPDDGDELPTPSRLTRHMIYAKGPLMTRPGKRYFSLQRTGYAGMQRYGTFGWSGDVFSIWSSLAVHVQLGLNYSMTASPYWGSDIGGFVATKEFTGELFARWFEFATFTPLFRSHGRIWGNRLPWGWSTGKLLPENEATAINSADPSEWLNPAIEPICKKYLELRYQLLPYNYTIGRENYDSALPLMRALWLHYPKDPVAVACSDEYLWGRNILVAPVTEKGTTTRKLYLPEGLWYDFWTNRAYQGNQHINRYVDLTTLPLYVKSGTILPMDPIRQYTAEKVTEPTTLRIYPGEDGFFTLYEDDGETMDYQKNNGVRTLLSWNDKERRLTIAPAGGSPTNRTFIVQLMSGAQRGDRNVKTIDYTGVQVAIKL